MIRPVRAELKKLRGPLLLWVTVAMALGALALAVVSHETASSEYRCAEANAEWWEKGAPLPHEVGMVAGPEFDKWVSESRQEARQALAEAGSGVALAASTQRPLGAGGLAAASMGSAMGVFALLLLASFHVSGEWSRGSIEQTMLQSGRRVQFVIAKLMSLWVVGLWLLLVSWMVLVLWGLVSQHVYPIPAGHSPETLGWALGMIAKLPLVVLLVAALGVAAGVLMRNPIGALAVSTLAVVVGAFLTVVGSAAEVLSPAAWIADWMGFEQREYLVYFWWIRKVSDPDPALVSLAIVGLVVLSVAVAAVVMRRRDVVG